MTPRQRKLKAWGKARLITVRDRLAEGAWWQAKGAFLLAGLQHVCWRAGKSNDWIFAHVFGMADRHPELIRYGREAAFVPYGMPHVRSTGAQS